MNEAKLSDSSVNASPIRIRSPEISYGWGNLTEQEPIPGKFPSTDANNEIQFMGWENPRFVIRGLLDESPTALSDGMTLALLKSFAKSTGSTYLYDDTFATDGTKIKIESFNVQKNAKDKTAQIYNYSITALETL